TRGPRVSVQGSISHHFYCFFKSHRTLRARMMSTPKQPKQRGDSPLTSGRIHAFSCFNFLFFTFLFCKFSPPDFTLPLYWDSMGENEYFQEFLLEPSSAEYHTVQKAFNKTAQKMIVRLQNTHLRRVYEMQKKNISEKNQQDGAGEKLLYHGTSQETYMQLYSLSGKKVDLGVTSFGHGTYFAVNASYNANATYSRPAADGTQAVFVARVLTGMYTVGHSAMRVPPPRSSQQPHDCYDSVVDRIDNPSTFVVFHDNQAYPDYLITFS
uniref:Poly [ADP-ribose] polymerase n=1 Tax=Nothobranchius furzeri TaxID=105023 RepID=A0A8C6PSS5_NOTFU